MRRRHLKNICEEQLGQRRAAYGGANRCRYSAQSRLSPRSLNVRQPATSLRVSKRRRIVVRRKDLDTIAVDTLYKTVRAITVSHCEEETFNDDEQDKQTTGRQMAAVRRHERRRLSVRSELGVGLIADQYFWRQTRTRSVHR